jgi:hypothetical protein
MPINDPILYWTMDNADISGTTITDRGSGGYNGTMNNSPITGVTGKIAQAVEFDNTYYQRIENDAVYAAVEGKSGLSVSCWQNTDIGSLDVGFTGGENNGITLFGGSIGIVGSMRKDGEYNTVQQTSLSLSGWNHFIAVYDGSIPRVVLYLNGSHITSFSYSNGDPSYATSSASTAGNFYVGYSPQAGTYREIGVADEVRLYDRALSSTDATDLFNFNGAGASSGLLMRRRRQAMMQAKWQKNESGLYVPDRRIAA